MARAYVRLDPAFYEKKLEQGYPLAAIGAYAGVLCLAELQPERGRFRDMAVLKALLGAGAKHAKFLIERGDLIVQSNGRIYVDGWDEWQEGDVTVKERMQRIRNRKANRNPDRNPTALAGRGAASSGAGQPARFSDAYKAFEACQGMAPTKDEKQWIDELCRDFGRERVARAMYDDASPDQANLLGRISKTLRHAA